MTSVTSDDHGRLAARPRDLPALGWKDVLLRVKAEAKKDNWKDLLIAYVVAGVDVGNEWEAWVAYLRSLGAGGDNEPGPQSISTIASMRFNALINDTAIVTKTHPHGRVQTSPGLIDSPCPL